MTEATRAPTDELCDLLKAADAVVYYVPPGTPEDARKQIARWVYACRDAQREAERLRAIVDQFRDELRCVHTSNGTPVYMDLRGAVFARILGVETVTKGDAE